MGPLSATAANEAKKNMRSKVELCHVNAPLYGVFSVSTFTLADAFLTHFNLNLKNVK